MSATENNSSSGQKRPPEGDDNGGGKRPAVDSPDDEENVCWLCLDAVHESGLPLRRDCSCRGGSGYAHLPCIVEYAKDASQKNERAGWTKFSEAWTKCANCNQNYLDDLALDLADELISFVQSNYAGDRLWHMLALNAKLYRALQTEVIKDTSIKILTAVIEYMRETQPPVPIAVYQIEAHAYSKLGNSYLRPETKESPITGVEYFEKSLRLARAHLPPGEVSMAEVLLAQAKSKCEGRAFQINEEMLKSMKQAYQDGVKKYGQEAVSAINFGAKYAMYLKSQAFRGIEAERLLTKLAAICIRVHGSEHKTTKWVSRQLALIKERRVGIMAQQGVKLFQALRYEDDGKKCIVQGPIATPRKIRDEGQKAMLWTSVVGVNRGTPVICSGLKQKANLNGKIGDTRGFDEATGCLVVHFEEKGLGEHLIQLKFLRIAFDLPPAEPSVDIDGSPQNGES